MNTSAIVSAFAAEDAGGKTALQAYLSQYPQGPYRQAARSYLHQIEIDKTSAKSVDRH